MKPDSFIFNGLKGSFSVFYVLFFMFGTLLSANATGSAPLSIPDDNIQGVTSARMISQEGIFKSNSQIEISCYISHSWVGDLTLVLIAPNGTSMIIADGIGKNRYSDGCPSDNLSLIFTADGLPLDNITCEFSDAADDQTATLQGSAVKAGKYLPKESFFKLQGLSIKGLWSLQIIDAAPGNIGWLLDWDFHIGNIPAANPAVTLSDPINEPVVGYTYELFDFINSRDKQDIIIPFAIPDLMEVTLEVFDQRGKNVFSKELLFLKGQNQFNVKRKDLKKGIYYYYIKTQNQLLSRKMVLN
jgi:subtilisin-like proprotein convertase family protein